jgi:Zn-dependent peptidase ImmA (M78 family)
MSNSLIGITPAELLQKLDLITPPYNPFSIAKKLGLEVSQDLDFDNINESGSIARKGDKISIWINPLDPEARQRFTLAHELGHYINDFLSSNDSKKIVDTPDTLYRNGNSNSCETKANRFAAQLLMPKADIFTKARELISSSPKKSMPGTEFVEKMAEIFEVSKPAMLVRLKTLGIINQDFTL